MKKGQLALTFFEIKWCPGEDSVTRARPRLRLQAQPFESSRKARRRFASWAINEKGRLEADLFETDGAQERLHIIYITS
ncbi:hypothetical protein [Burkholderia sp. MSHR3999]|uniref:hypothetical protein n=1 Tax=Burkholderia sp. MSHR3999 TaxID=1542965 RepID=UPI0012E016FF|nr:hypothetical protein [Burkholderia sp. MSHR3999]